MPLDGTTGTFRHCRNGDPVAVAGAVVPVLVRGCPNPGGRDGASVQFYISTVIEGTRKNGDNIYFVVGMSDKWCIRELLNSLFLKRIQSVSLLKVCILNTPLPGLPVREYSYET
jgi:hypothetical protein